MRIFQYRIGERDSGRSVYDYLIREQSFSRRSIIQLKKAPDGLLCNGVHTRTVDKLAAGDLLEIHMGEEASPAACSDAFVPVVYEDEDLIAFDKPAGMPCHQAKNHQEDTLANVFAARCLREGGSRPFRAVYRLDKDTSGIVVAAKNTYAAGRLNGKIGKWYLALVQGKPEPAFGIIEAPIRRLHERTTIRLVSPDGQYARTRYQRLATTGGHSLMRVWIDTGRTHQIRVHFSYLGFPLAGDGFYGGSQELLSRHALHCAGVDFLHPVTGKNVYLFSVIHPDMQEALRKTGLNDAAIMKETEPF